MTAPPFIGSFCMSVGAQSTAQSWHTDPLTPKVYNAHNGSYLKSKYVDTPPLHVWGVDFQNCINQRSAMNVMWL